MKLAKYSHWCLKETKIATLFSQILNFLLALLQDTDVTVIHEVLYLALIMRIEFIVGMDHK